MMQRRIVREVKIRAEKVYKEIKEAECVASAVLMERLKATHSELFYVLRMLQREGRVEAVSLGRTSLWCASHEAAEEVLARLTNALKSLLCGRRRYIKSKEAFRLIAEDPEARRLFSRHMLLRYNPATIQLLDALMERLFGEPMKASRGGVYVVQCAVST
jgi:hypothetical protein